MANTVPGYDSKHNGLGLVHGSMRHAHDTLTSHDEHLKNLAGGRAMVKLHEQVQNAGTDFDHLNGAAQGTSR